MNANHTPGPWNVWESDDKLLSIGPGTVGTQICNFFDENGEAYPCAEPNASLIAAAPDLLKALKSLRHADGCYCDAAFAMPDGSHPRHSDECISARAAIAKAEGGAE